MNGFIRDLKKEGDIHDYYLIDQEEKLGEGESAEVRKAVKKETGETFAIKIIAKADLDENSAESLKNELKILGVVDHPNIVRVYEYYDCREKVYIVMELMSGGELFDYLADIDHYTEKQAIENFRPLVDAIRYCHSLGIVHRDLKPQNLLLTCKGEDAIIKISDFGLAKFLIPKTDEQLFTACGTPLYVAPEVMTGRGYDSKVDCWSLGAILYVMLCGFPPFYAENHQELVKLILKGDFEFLSPEWDNISKNAKDLINKLLIVNPKERLTAEEVLSQPWLTEANNSEHELSIKKYEKYKKDELLKSAIMTGKAVKKFENLKKKKNK